MRQALRDIGLLLAAASYGPFGVFGAILEADGPSSHTRLPESAPAPGPEPGAAA